MGISFREPSPSGRRPLPDLRVRREHPGREGGHPRFRELRSGFQELGQLAQAQQGLREHAAASAADLLGLGSSKNTSSFGPSGEVDTNQVPIVDTI